MYRLLRNLHLIAGTFAALFLFAYALSAAQMAYRVTYSGSPTLTDASIDVPDGIDGTPRALARWLMAQHDLRGDLTEIDSDDGVTRLTIVRPGTIHKVEYDAKTRTARVNTRVVNGIGMLNRVHHIGGVSHDYWAINAWGWFLFVASLALAVLAVSGVVMWFERHQERLAGAIVLVAGLAWGLTLLILIRIA